MPKSLLQILFIFIFDRLTRLRKQHYAKMFYRKYLKTRAWKWRRHLILWRDAYECTECGYDRYLQVHHITYKRRGYEAYTDLRTLCKDCHRKEHKK